MSIENTDYRYEVLDLESPYDIRLVDRFLSDLGFSYSTSELDYTMIIYNLNGQLIGTGSYQKNILKFVAVSPKFRETTAFAEIVTHLTDEILKVHKTSFVYTKPESAIRFEGLGYKTIAKALPLFTVLEFGYKTIKDYKKYLLTQKREADKTAAIVVNCNPFTNGHKYLIETAASENDLVYLFVVEEDRSVFDFQTRWNLIEKGIAHLSNIVMLKGGQYIVSGATFPSYFLKNESIDDITQKQAELDISLFANQIVPLLEIKKRYVGTENYCKTTASYNDAMKKILPAHGVEIVEIQRKVIGTEDNYISASKVRAAIKNDSLNGILDFLPLSTQEYLMSDESNEIKEKIKQSAGRH